MKRHLRQPPIELDLIRAASAKRVYMTRNFWLEQVMPDCPADKRHFSQHRPDRSMSEIHAVFAQQFVELALPGTDTHTIPVPSYQLAYTKLLWPPAGISEGWATRDAIPAKLCELCTHRIICKSNGIINGVKVDSVEHAGV